MPKKRTRKRTKRTPRSIPISIDFEGKTYHGWYTVSGDMITVTGGLRSKTTQLGGMPADMLAELLLVELVPQNKDQSEPQ
jgi:hypothetical protein